MTTKTIDILDAQIHLNELLSLTQQGTEIILAKNNTPMARLVPLKPATTQMRIAGLHQGSIWTSDDFDDCSPEL